MPDAGGAGGSAGAPVPSTGGAGGSGGVAGTGGVGGASGNGGVGGTGGLGGAMPPPPPPPLIPARCAGDATKTAMIGDSYLALSGEVTMFLQGYSGQQYRTYYVSGTQMVGGLPPNIPDQARMALAEAPVQTFLMDGGGNDVLIGDLTCRVTGPAPGSPCEATVLNVLDAARALLDEAAAAGVQEVVFFFYPHIPPGIVALNHIALNEVLDFAAPLARDVCEGATAVDCTFIDLRQPFDGHPEYIGLDGIHPTTAGSEVIAQLLWAAMQENCATGLSLGR